MPIPESAAPDWLHWLERCESTNTWAIDHPTQLQHGDAVYTPQQTAGRGRQGRRWYAPPGGLTASLILDNLSASQLTGFSLVVGLAVIYTIEDLLPHLQGQLGLKWPNDVMAQSRKLAGILCEVTSSSRVASSATRVVIGMGLNYQVEFERTSLTPAEVGQPISLHQICDSPPDELILLERLRHYLRQASALMAQRCLQSSPHSGIAAFLPALRQRDWLLDRQISLQVSQSNVAAGQAAGIDGYGRLLIRQADGEPQPFASGHVSHNNPIAQVVEY